MGVLQKVGETRTFIEESCDELQKVTWPDSEQLKSATLVVIIFCVLVSGIISLMDFVTRVVMDLVMGIFGA